MFKRLTDFILTKTMFLGVVMLLASGGWVSAYSNNEAQQQAKITVTGTVFDSSGPIIGANVMEKGKPDVGTITDMDGNFSLNVAPNATLVISYLGYTTQEIAVNGRASVQITLSEEAGLLEEVVVVGYGTQKKVNLTGSVASVSAEKLENRATPSLSTSLAGLAPGVNITQGKGKPGDERVEFRIRGAGSFNNSDPMILVDGMNATMDAVNPDDVESISFLKDAASAAIYGSRAANGVVLITTKKGKRDSAPKVTYSNLFASERPVTGVSFMSDMPAWMEFHNRAQLTNNPAVTSFWFTQETIDAWKNANANPGGTYTDPVTGNQIANSLAYPNTDWATVMFRPSFFQKHTLSVQGGSPTSNYLLSVGYQDNPGTLENTAQQRYNIRANVETKIADFIKFGTQTYATKFIGEPGNVEMTYLFQAYPGINPKYQGKFGASEDPAMTNMNNVLRSVAALGGKDETTRIFTTWYAGVELFKGFNAEAKFNYQNAFRNNEHWSQDLPSYRFRTNPEVPVENIGVLEQATSFRHSYKEDSYTADLTLNYANTFGNHDVSALLGYEQYYWSASEFEATKKGLIDWSITDFTSGAEMQSMGGKEKRDYAMISYFGRVNYAYKGKYLFEANFRSDASSRFAPGHRWGLFPSFSAGWRISEESFFEPLRSSVNNLKLRASWGELGNTLSDNYYSWQALYSKKNNVMGQSVVGSLVQTQLSNLYMSWEKVTTTDFGFDASFLNQRLNLEFDVYNRYTTGILTNPPLYYTMGNIKSPMSNTADMSNNGVEFTIGWRDRKGDFSYGISLNAAYNTNKVTKFKGALDWGEIPGEKDINGNPVMGWVNLSDVSTDEDNRRRVEGHMLDEFFLRKSYQGTGTYTRTDGSVDPNGGPRDGMIRTKADLEWVRAMLAAGYKFNGKTVDMPNDARTTGGRGSYLWYGELIMADVNGDGNYGNDNDREFLGKSRTPKWTLGTTITAEWKGIDLSMTWAGRYGSWHYIYSRGVNSTITENTDALPSNAASLYYSYDPQKAMKEYDTYDPATDPNANINGKYPRLLNTGLTSSANTLYLYNTSFLKLKTLQIGYSLPKQWLQAAKISRLRVFFSGENLLTFCSKDFPGVDPELGGSINVYPLAKMLSGGLSITF